MSSDNKIGLNKIMKDIETKTEEKVLEGYKTGKINLKLSQSEKTAQEEVKMKQTCDALVNIMLQGADEFKAKTGRNMTYSEMRQMYG
jgi:hypothetical protein